MWLFKKKEYNSDEELLKHYKQSGNKELFADLFKKHVSVVYGTCLFYLQDKEEAQDATMQLFEKLMLDINNREIDNFKGWLSFVVRNHCISLIRKNKSVSKNIKSYYEFEYETPDYEKEEKINSISDDLLLEKMKECLPKLKENQRVCVELFYLKNKSYQEIANETNFSLNEIKSYIQNGKRNLKLLIEDASAKLSVTTNKNKKMRKSNNISNNTNLTKEQKHSLERSMQETDLSYLSSIAFEQFGVTNEEIEKLNSKIDGKITGGTSSFNTIFISVLCGLLIGISIFFVIFQKSKNHPSVYQSLEEEKAQLKLENNIVSNDTVFPKIESKELEHYNTTINDIEEVSAPEVLETLPSKPIDINLSEKEEEQDIVFQFTPNAPIVFIHNMKVTNYRLYYFKNSYAIDLNANTGVPAQYGSMADIETAYLNKSNSYLAHKIIKKAMNFLAQKTSAIVLKS